MFADPALAHRIDEAEASLSCDIAELIVARGSVPGALNQEFAGGVAFCAGPASPINKVIGARIRRRSDRRGVRRAGEEIQRARDP